MPDGGAFLAARLDGSMARYEVKSGSVQKGGAATLMATTEDFTGPVPGRETAVVMLEEVEGGENPALVKRSETKGAIQAADDRDEFPFSAQAGESWIFEINAARSKSKLDSRLEILDAKGEPVEQVVLQAVRDSWLTFRGKDSTGTGDFRVQNWEEMELNEFLFLNGEVVKLWQYPRGPDSGFIVYPGFGERRTYFHTSGLSHPVGQTCYIVRAHVPGSEPGGNGLPVYRLYYENDDDPDRVMGSDSRLHFTAPTDGYYRVRVSDVRGFGGDDHQYTLTARNPEPDFTVGVTAKDIKIAPGSGRELLFTAKRKDGFGGAIELTLEGMPGGLSVAGPITIEAGQDRAWAVLEAASDFAGLSAEEAKKVILKAKAEVAGVSRERKSAGFGAVEVMPDKPLRVALRPDGGSGRVAEDGVLEFVMRPGETITATVVAERNGFKGEIDFGKEDSGRNLPHGVFVDNIGLSGLRILADKSEQQVFITASKVVEETVRNFHLVTPEAGGHSTKPVRLRIIPEDAVAER